MNVSIFREKKFKKEHEIFNCPPDEWAANNGATHTLFIQKDFHGCGTRPAKLLKTVCYVMNEDYTWDKWEGRVIMNWEGVKPQKLSDEQMKKWPEI